MLRKILYAYLGALVPVVLLLPLAVIVTMGGHSLMYVSILSALLGPIFLLMVYEFREGASTLQLIISLVVKLFAYVMFFYVFGLVFINSGWILLTLVAPLSAGLISHLVSSKFFCARPRFIK